MAKQSNDSDKKLQAKSDSIRDSIISTFHIDVKECQMSLYSLHCQVMYVEIDDIKEVLISVGHNNVTIKAYGISDSKNWGPMLTIKTSDPRLIDKIKSYILKTIGYT